MAINSELTKIELGIRNLLYREHGIVLQRATFLPNTHVVRTKEHYEAIKKSVATGRMTEYMDKRKEYLDAVMKKLQNPDPSDKTWNITPSSYVVKVESSAILSVTDAQTLAYAKVTSSDEYSIFYSGPAQGSFAHDSEKKELLYQSLPNWWTGWDRIPFIVNSDTKVVQDSLYIQVVVSSPSDELVRFLLPVDYRETRDKLDEWLDEVTDSDVVTWIVSQPPVENPTLSVMFEESYPNFSGNGEAEKAPYFDYCDTSLRMDQSKGTLYLWNNSSKKFESSSTKPPGSGSASTSDKIFNSLEYNGLYYAVTHVTNDWSSLATSESHNIVLRSNVSISINLIKQGLAPAEVYYYFVQCVNNVANSEVLNTSVNPVSSIDNKPRTCELYLRRDEYLDLNGYKLLARLRATVLEDLSRVFLVH